MSDDNQPTGPTDKTVHPVKRAYAQEIADKRYRELNTQFMEKKLYLERIQPLIGCPNVTYKHLLLLAPLVEQRLGRKLTRFERRSKWALLGAIMTAFPDPTMFVVMDIRLPFVDSTAVVHL